ncbi:hypothetical protein CC86DRAFT_311751 [Ophiobolus disseminans]|uniref:Nucleoporin Nup133/Nup155-like C-terminal domain-containing protein n=1 Tax=Ophiobolus disseminans TaxID=1469910 RepID=A0A6A7AKB4_9PLEO|nr:hypothetical protein CC86DRAFT_311751 [Ophiobolus disseminans]
MFSPEASIQSARSSLRNNPRRRQRTSDGLQQQQPRRKRSKISNETFADKDEAHVNGNGSVLMNGHADHGDVEKSLAVMDMPVREKKAPPKRASREDTSLYLTKTANYSIKPFRGFPNALRQPTFPYSGSALTSAGLALALTHEKAVVWDYNSETSTKSIALSLPFTLRASDPLPFGAIIHNHPSNDFGVVAVAPSTGKIAFWENIDSAYAQRNHGVEGTVKLYSGETITELVEIGHAGYVLVSSNGRLAHLTLRDSQGRPSVSATILSAPSSSNGSFFSFKGLLGGAIRKTIASVKARPSESKGHMEVIAATRSGLLQQWDLSWSGQHNFIREVNVQAQITAAVRGDSAPESRSLQEVQLLDFAIKEQQDVQDGVGLLILVASSGQDSLDYALLEMNVTSTGGTVSRAIPLRSFQQSQIPQEPTGVLLLPFPGHTAFVLFPGAICVASLAQPEESPNNQLLADSGRSTLPFQDTVYFREDLVVGVSGHALGDRNPKEKRATALIFLHHFGLFKISAQPPSHDDKDEERLKVTARSKLEQAALFSTMPGNLLDFSIKSRFSFSEEEVAEAAVDVSSRILSSSYDSLEKVTSSMDDQFQHRATALRRLIDHLQSDYPPLPFQTKWRLLGQAEKLEAAHKLWSWYQGKLQDQQLHPESYPDKILMHDIVRVLHERYKTAIQPELGETDPIRQFFLKDPDTLQVLIPWGWFFLRTFYIKDGRKEQPFVMQRLSEATDVMLVTLESAFSFRKNNIERYGLDAEILEDGILRPKCGAGLLPQFWTSSHNIVNSIRSLVDVGRNLAVSNYEVGIFEGVSSKIASDNPRLVKIGCQTHVERFQWALEQSDEKLKETGRTLKIEWNTNVRPHHIMGLMEVGLATEGMKLAEHYHDMPTLANLIWEETEWLESTKASSRSKMEQAESVVKLTRLSERISRYFELYGDEWAEAYFSKHISENRAAQLFKTEFLDQAALTRFLRAEPSRARLRWINEVIGEQNFGLAAKSLYDAATKQETNSWCQRVELSLARLASLGKDEVEPPQAAPKEKTKRGKNPDISVETLQKLEYANIQEQVYGYLLPIVTGALDDEGAVELLMSEFGQGHLRDRPAHQSILREGFNHLIHHRVIEPALMIDILTLMDSDDGEPNIKYKYAIDVLMIHWNEFNRTTRDGLWKLIWKRLFLRDNWNEFNQTRDTSDAELHEAILQTNLGSTLACVMEMMDGEKFVKFKLPESPEEVIEAGTAHWELATRFASEDLREPIIKDNQLDGDLLREHLDKHRLGSWFLAAQRAARKAIEEMRQEEQEAYQQYLLAQQGATIAVESNNEGPSALAAPADDMESMDDAGSDTFEADTESVADQDADVDMQES